MLVEVLLKVEHSYSGRMRLVVFARPGGSPETIHIQNGTGDAIGHESSAPLPTGPRWSRLFGLRALGKSPIGAFQRFNQLGWNSLPARLGARSNNFSLRR